jgi:hypothetical protein
MAVRKSMAKLPIQRIVQQFRSILSNNARCRSERRSAGLQAK